MKANSGALYRTAGAAVRSPGLTTEALALLPNQPTVDRYNKEVLLELNTIGGHRQASKSFSFIRQKLPERRQLQRLLFTRLSHLHRCTADITRVASLRSLQSGCRCSVVLCVNVLELEMGSI